LFPFASTVGGSAVLQKSSPAPVPVDEDDDLDFCDGPPVTQTSASMKSKTDDNSSSEEGNILLPSSPKKDPPASIIDIARPASPDSKPPVPASAPAPASTETSSEDSVNVAMNHHDSLCFLKIIGSIKSGQKLSQTSTNPNQPISIDTNKWSSSISRWWNGDSRSITVKILRGRFDSVFNNIDEAYKQHTEKTFNTGDAFNRSPKDILLNYARELSGAETGLRHLCHTYKHDIPISSELQVMLESVSIRKQTIDNMFTIKDN
jgi:hypothetical protein